MRVIKVGGSLFDWPDLAARLRAWLGEYRGEDLVLVPGGGPLAEAIRMYDHVHGLGEEASHWLALRTLTVNAHFLVRLLPRAVVVGDVRERGVAPVSILDMERFARSDERRRDALPSCWAVTSDSLALRVAAVAGAKELVLLKSVDLPAGIDWDEAGKRRFVDDHFAELMTQVSIPVRIVNLRGSGAALNGIPFSARSEPSATAGAKRNPV